MNEVSAISLLKRAEEAEKIREAEEAERQPALLTFEYLEKQGDKW